MYGKKQESKHWKKSGNVSYVDPGNVCFSTFRLFQEKGNENGRKTRAAKGN